ncbi:Protein nud1 [Lecanora helva]
MDQWLDSLSEDWVSQPRSPHSSSILRRSSSRDIPSPSTTTSQSRIPRYQPRTVSSQSAAVSKGNGRLSSVRSSSQIDGALKEKPSSRINASQRYDSQKLSQSVNTGAVGAHRKKESTNSTNGLVQGTVQHKASPGKGQSKHGTPDWKRRVLKENAGGDLFAPIGLESVFRPPTISNPQGKSAEKRKPVFSKDPPSKCAPAQPSISQVSKAPSAPTASQSSRAASPVATAPQTSEYVHDGQLLSNNRKDLRRLDVDTQAYIVQANSPHQGTLSISPANSSTHDIEVASCTSEHTRQSCDKSRNEDISPFYVSKHGTIAGGVEYAAIDMSMQKLRSQMDKMRVQQRNLPTSRSSDNGIDYLEAKSEDPVLREQQMDEVTSQSLPDDLSMGTDAYPISGKFVTIRRGGYSNDGSFQRRPVSPSLLPNLDGPSLTAESSTENGKAAVPELHRNFSQTKSRTPSSPPPSSLPQTPRSRNRERADSDDQPRSSGSPLKLFDKHDTYTNQMLIRRLSKFEETANDDFKEDNKWDNSSGLPTSPSPRRRRLFKQSWTDPSEGTRISRRISSFGDGELNDHPFPHRQGLVADNPKANPDQNIQSRADDFHFDLSNVHHGKSDDKVKSTQSRESISRRHSGRGSAERHGSMGPLRSSIARSESIAVKNTVHTATGKRLPYSPSKEPTPKRRKTLLTPEEPDAKVGDGHSSHDTPNNSVNGRKRKDALYDSNFQAADPSTLAMRHIRHPKLPTASQADDPCKPAVPRPTSDTGNAPPGEETALESRDDPTVDPPTQIVAGALATLALNTAQEVTCGSRKVSVTTADFFNEAQQIMQLIRAKGRPHSSHATTDGSEVGNPTIVEESFVEESTKDQFSRPPSREGSPQHLKDPPKLGSRAVSHLRKFEDDQDLGLALSSSLKTLKINQSRRQSKDSNFEHNQEKISDSGTESDPPNIRIRESTVQNHKRQSSSSTNSSSLKDLECPHRSQDSNPSSGPSSNRSNPPASSNSSTNRMIIAPQTVAHLLSDTMAGMVFDHERQVWVKRKSSCDKERTSREDRSISDETEEDFFADIPDLSVNEMEELQRVKDAVSSVKSMASRNERIAVHDQATFGKSQNETPDEQADCARPRTAEGKSMPTVENSSAPSKYSHFASSGIQPGTRATSWGDEAFPSKEPQLPSAPTQSYQSNEEHENEGQVDQEISIHEGRKTPSPKHQNHRKYQARVVTVAFSSPLVEHREPSLEGEDTQDSDEEESQLTLDDSPVKSGPRQAETSMHLGSVKKLGRDDSSHRMSKRGHSHPTRPMSRLDEEDEMSIVHCSVGPRHVNMEVAITTPLPISRSLMLPSSTNGRSSLGFQLSPLPEFTVHQIDKPIDGKSSEVAKRLPTRDVDNRLSLAAQDLVSKLTDLEPYEPYWDYLRTLDLRERNLGTLHMLAEFCGRVEELDVSDNQIRELNGIPTSVRQLNIRGNSLSDLAAWDNLQNLQYLDVSNNKLSSLQGFQNLFHLRSLKADGNEISTVDGLEDLNGLTSLSLRGNRLEAVDFENFDLQRLTKLDLHNNELTSVLNLHNLPVLQTCILSNNKLEALDFAISITLSALETLDVSDNRLSFVDLAELPNLKTLKVDRNSLASIESLNSLQRLGHLSWREQNLVPAYGFSEVQYQPCHEVRNLCLSGNAISTFDPSAPFLNLQALELASTGLQSLSPDFGLKCPNLRTLNLNYNALRDLRPLLGIVKLQKLFITGNRVTRLRRTAAVLDRLWRDLEELDLRNNPLTVGFYTPQNSSQDEKQIVPHTSQTLLEHEDSEARSTQVYLLPPLDDETDQRSLERLDEDTKLRRRVYEMLIVNGCKKLERLDGLRVNKRSVSARDGVWERLVQLGVLKEKSVVSMEA